MENKIVLTEKQIDEIVNDLTGTTGSLDAAIREAVGEQYCEDDIADESLEKVWEEVFNCDSCGWWCSTDECADDHTCQECFELENAVEEDEDESEDSTFEPLDLDDVEL